MYDWMPGAFFTESTLAEHLLIKSKKKKCKLYDVESRMY